MGMLDASKPIMNTTYFKTSLPDFYTAYPDAAITYKVTNTRYPRAEFDHDNIILDMPVELTVEVAGTDVAVLSLDLTVEGIMQTYINFLSGKFPSTKHTTTIK